MDSKNKKSYIVLKLLKILNSYIPNWYKYGKEYRDTYKFLLKSENWNVKNKKEYQLNKLKEFVKYCYENVPYYKELFDKENIDLNIKNIDEIKKIPIITKEIIRRENEKLVSKKYVNKDILESSTGGTTGIPLKLYSSKKVNRKDKAYIDFYWSKIGYKVKGINKIAIIRGEKPNKGISERIGTKLILSSYMLKEDNILFYIKALEKFNPDYIHCFPSAIALIAKHLNDNSIKINLDKLKGILTSSETLYDYQKEYVNKIFNVPIYDFYSQSEKASIAISIGNNRKYYFDQTYAFNEQNDGVIISTGFINDVMPLLRYNTEDICEVVNHSRELIETNKIEGRMQDYLIGKNGEKISLSATNFHDDIFKDIIEFQYEQNVKGKVNLKIVSKENYKDLEILKLNVIKLLGNVLDVEIKKVEKIKNTNRGKKMLLIQNLKDVKEVK